MRKILGLVVVAITFASVASAQSRNFTAHLTGDAEVPVVDTRATGQVHLRLENDGLHFKLIVANIEGVRQAHIHVGPPDENGPVVAFLFGPVEPGGRSNGPLAEGVIRSGDVIGPISGDFQALLHALRTGNAYVNVHTASNPGGEIRGQIKAPSGR